ncbi:hypothetical protein EVAR_92761_1 [Eumeta japonica]|uniref:Uncharacterized protein n=1 Tax=Eumeta variegata TaxID=151549 RepID=A0A4C1T030_EUMVA|nr:hypothetical protein EVAR_92761_1 [Eumeta japonica]
MATTVGCRIKRKMDIPSNTKDQHLAEPESRRDQLLSNTDVVRTRLFPSCLERYKYFRFRSPYKPAFHRKKRRKQQNLEEREHNTLATRRKSGSWILPSRRVRNKSLPSDPTKYRAETSIHECSASPLMLMADRALP